MFFVVVAVVGTSNLVRSRIGRAFVAIRDQDIAAEIIGIDIFRYKLVAFAISSFYAGATGFIHHAADRDPLVSRILRRSDFLAGRPPICG